MKTVVVPATTWPSMPELPEHELVSSSAALASSFPSFICCASLWAFGVNGSLNGGGDGVVGNRGHVDASSSAKNVDIDGDVFNDCGKFTPSNDWFADISKLFIVFCFGFSLAQVIAFPFSP